MVRIFLSRQPRASEAMYRVDGLYLMVRDERLRIFALRFYGPGNRYVYIMTERGEFRLNADSVQGLETAGRDTAN